MSTVAVVDPPCKPLPAEGLCPRLDRGTQLGNGLNRSRSERPPWVLVAHLEAGEASIYRDDRHGGDADDRRQGEGLTLTAEAEADNRERSIRRIKTRARRYAVANHCDQLVTATYRTGDPCGECGHNRPWKPCRTCRRRVRADVREFCRRARASFGGTIPYLRALEDHRDGSIHVHMVMPRFFAYAERLTRRLARLWSWGFVDADPPKVHRKGVQTEREGCRAVARYAVKYATSDVGDGSLDPYEHAVETGEGFQHAPLVGLFWDRASAEAAAVVLMGGVDPSYRFDSADDPGFAGFPLLWLSFP